ncbi:hypothetical protein EOA32_15350 [Mesorhizobium sp. M1A.F.Ca.ET.072.01.1.1]|uniref:hypothetical protein n=1 Tax=Mesorhizobium sp. M1A.F.Ca.ET.072.01.1.1 TaxID=2496753 RepID=UPI000FD5C6A4|nr:hypothetical protein [Mesorhizobium sp. M1A.F.Ca.ET.072.01.1.1]RUW51657.1 hypothetical protein EOA32_15350 [Mesorhizobium sp. M1A.F.Ca.ET.072.01.1.1]TIU95928.1 MAG: hypothetical protein E5W04_29680 [Mesorhizobium sp.]
MPDLEMELRHLRDAERLIFNAEMCVTLQEMHLARVSARGDDPKKAEFTLRLYEQTLAAFYQQRESILSSIRSLHR